MKKYYQLFVDYSHTWEEGDISVLSVIIEAENAKEAKEIMNEKLLRGEYNEETENAPFYIWECSEDDIVER